MNLLLTDGLICEPLRGSLQLLSGKYSSVNVSCLIIIVNKTGGELDPIGMDVRVAILLLEPCYLLTGNNVEVLLLSTNRAYTQGELRWLKIMNNC